MFFVISLFKSNQNIDFTFVASEINVFDKVPEIKEVIKEIKEEKVLDVYHGYITAYGPDCVGCTTGYTASGYYVRNGNIYYNDNDYGKIRIVAADKSLPFGTIVRISGLDIFSEPVIAIVLDRGSAIGFNRKVYFDLLYNSEKETDFFGKRNATFEVLRRGY